MAIKLSYSRVEQYKECPAKYKFKYIDKYEKDQTKSPLLFGMALDGALNYVLKQFKAKKPINEQYAKNVFSKLMKTWEAKNPLIFFKSELPSEYEPDDDEGNQLRVWMNLNKVGFKMIETYIKDIVPLFEEVKEVQKKKVIVNDEGDTFTLVLDAIVKLKSGQEVLIDNKSSSKPYPKNAVLKSTQLATYNEHYPTPFSGYIVLQKKLGINEEVKWQLLVDKIDETLKQETFEAIDKTLSSIKAGDFRKNKKACYSYGKRCDYYDACHNKNYSGLVKR